jgi:hypothetical protein
MHIIAGSKRSYLLFLSLIAFEATPNNAIFGCQTTRYCKLGERSQFSSLCSASQCGLSEMSHSIITLDRMVSSPGFLVDGPSRVQQPMQYLQARLREMQNSVSNHNFHMLMLGQQGLIVYSTNPLGQRINNYLT